jgi:hypothetical protein
MISPTGTLPQVPITVTDRGDSYVVDVGGRTKMYADPARNCRERARVSAAFIALALAPETAPAGSSASTSSSSPSSASSSASSSSETPPPPAPATAAPPPPPPSTATTPPPPAPTSGPGHHAPAVPPWARFDLRGAFEDGPEIGAVGGGGMVRAAFGWKAIGGHVLCEWLGAGSTALRSHSGRVSLERWPCAIGGTARVLTEDPHLEASFDLGLALGALRAEGHDLAANEGHTVLEIGARAAADLLLRLGPEARGFAPVIGVEAEYLPTPYHLNVSGAGPVADTPRAWVTFTAGLSWTVE